MILFEHTLLGGGLGCHEEDETVVAGLIFPAATTADRVKKQRRLFLQELQMMHRLRTAHTVNIYGAITSDKYQLVLVMELLVGGSLKKLLHGSAEPLSKTQKRRIIEDICSGMMFLHGKSTVHGDLKSANVMLDGDGRAKVNTITFFMGTIPPRMHRAIGTPQQNLD